MKTDRPSLSENPLEDLIIELRPTLESIQLTCELIQQKPDEPVGSISNKLEGMRQCCDTLLSLADEAESHPATSASSSPGSLLIRALSLRDLGTYLHRQMSIIASHKERHVELELAEDLPALIYTHPVWLEQTIRNLMANAIRHGEGIIRLKISCQPKHVVITVSDEGPGIPKDQQEEIFKPRVQLLQENQQEKPGIGLGLSLASSWIKRLGGTIEVTSQKGGGSTFQVTLPRDPSRESARVQSQSDYVSSSQTNR